MKFLVTGGAGFIGVNFVRYLLERDPEASVICVDKLTYAGNYDNIADLEGNERFFFEKADICDREAMFRIFETYRPDYAVNFAAESHVDRSIKDPSVFLTTNIIGTQTLLEAARAFPVRRFHQVSTDEVYGDLPLDRPDLLFDESYPLKPSSPYSASKASADLLVLAYQRTYGMPVTISRCSNNYGPYQFPEKLIPLMISRASKDSPVPVYGDGKNVRDWLYVEDHCSAIDRILRDGRDGAVYNVGGNNEKANIDLVKHVLNLMNKPESLITYVTDRPGHDRRYAINPAKMKRELNWQPETDFETGMARTLRWYQENQHWIQRIESGEYRESYKRKE